MFTTLYAKVIIEMQRSKVSYVGTFWKRGFVPMEIGVSSLMENQN